MELEYDYFTGSIYKVSGSLTRSIGQYSRHYTKIKIGITNSPTRRLKEHSRNITKWDLMVIKYATTSV
jgi:hypothetical protein